MALVHFALWAGALLVGCASSAPATAGDEPPLEELATTPDSAVVAESPLAAAIREADTAITTFDETIGNWGRRVVALRTLVTEGEADRDTFVFASKGLLEAKKQAIEARLACARAVERMNTLAMADLRPAPAVTNANGRFERSEARFAEVKAADADLNELLRRRYGS